MIIGKILKEGLDKKASDIIITAEEYPSLKINGDIHKLESYGVLTKEDVKSDLFSVLTEKQKVEFIENLELDLSLELKGYSRFRVNVFKQKNGFGMIFRPISALAPNFSELGLPDVIKDFTLKGNGLVLITGSVGSGKTTTLASLINEININQSKHIITIEDPIEFLYKNENSIVEQREVGSSTHSFENGLKYTLRQAPDVIMIGEMRDLETFRLALRAAETGNLVFATLHTSGAARTIARIIDMFPGDEKNQIKQQLSESLLGVVWQKLLKNKTGDSRVVATEVLTNNTSVSNMIRKDQVHQINNAIETGSSDGMITMKKTLEELFGKGLISEDTFDKNLQILDI